MANLARWARRSSASPWPSITLDQLPYWFGQFGYNGLGYGPAMIQTIQQNKETISADFQGFINGAYKTNGAIFAIMLTRSLLFSEARFQFQRLKQGRPGELFGTDDLALLENPWPNATTGDLLTRAISDADLSGNFYAARQMRLDKKGPKIARLRPDWVTIIKGSYDDPGDAWDPGAELLGYIYTPGGFGSGRKEMFFLPEECMHWAPIIDPVADYRGMSWVQPVLAEVLGDRAMTTHKDMYFTNGATPNLVVTMDTGKMDRKVFQQWVETFEAEHSGTVNAYKTLYLGQGADAKVVGSSLKDLDYSVVQGHGETRLAAAGGVPAIIVGFSEGLESATYSNFAQARRAFADKTLRPLWRNFAGSLETLIPAPGGSRLWYDDRDIPFLQEDEADEADILLTKSTAIRLLVDSGYDPDSVVKAIENNDLSHLKHSGLYSVQLQAPGSDQQTNSDSDIAAMVKQIQSGGNGGNGTGNGTGNGAGNGNSSEQSKSTEIVPYLASASKRATLLNNVGNVEQLAQALIAAKANK